MGLDTTSWHVSFVILFIAISGNGAIEKIGNSNNAKYVYKTLWYKQKVDHFGFGNSSTFDQRYLVNDSHWQEAIEGERAGGPIFFYTGNEGDIEAFAQNTGFMWDIAEEFHAMLVFAEHRYYGQSIPFGNSSITPGNPKLTGYLSSEQALGDYAELVTYIKSTVTGSENSPVVAFGGSYGGMLAAWFRIKYPHICDGAIAGSAPIAQFSTNCDAFARIVTSDYRDGDKTSGATAVGEIGKSWISMNKLGKTKEGMKWLSDNFKLCTELNSTADVANLKDYLSDAWTNVAMMNYPYPTSFLMPLPGNPVEFISRRIATMPNTTLIDKNDKNETDPDKLNMVRIMAGAEVYYNFTGDAKCLNLQDTDQIGANMWDYQSCTEMVMPMCYKGGADDMFEKQDWNLTKVERSCQKKWKVTPYPHMADINYGSKKLQAASNIVFSNGLKDPWSSGGVITTISESVIAVIIPEGAHHLDLRGANPLDFPSVTKARELHKDNIQQWIQKTVKSQQATSRTILNRYLADDYVYMDKENSINIEVIY